MSDNTNGQQHRLTPKQAREQAAEALGFLAGKSIWIGDEEFEIPNRAMMDDDQKERMDDLDLETESWERHPDRTLDDGTIIPGQLKIPYRKNGKPVRPTSSKRVGIALWGKEKYDRFVAGKGQGSDIVLIQRELDLSVAQRERIDSKSVDSGGAVDVGAE
jgi:hypothetical protein